MDNDLEDVKRQYRELKEALLKGENSTFYSESDLLNIYDFAGDERDLHVQFEILALAASRFPDSVEFGSRRTFFIKDVLNEQGAAREIAARHQGESLSWTILQLSFLDDREVIIHRLQHALNHAKDLEDEDILRLVDIIDDKQLLDWAFDNRQAILPHCAYPETFLLELSEVFIDSGQYERAITLLEELTGTEAFNAGYWSRLSDAYALDGNFTESLSAIEYALAIDPGNPKYTLQQLNLLVHSDNLSNDDRNRLIDIFRNSDSGAEILHILFAALCFSNNADKRLFVKLLWEKLEKSDDLIYGDLIADYLLVAGTREDISRLIREYYLTERLQGEPDRSKWVERLYNDHRYTAVIELMNAYPETFDTPDSWLRLFESYYVLGDFKGITDIYLNPDSNFREKYHIYPDALIPMYLVAISLLRTGKVNEFTELARKLIDNALTIPYNTTDCLATTAAVNALRTLLNAVLTHTDYDINRIDPLSRTLPL